MNRKKPTTERIKNAEKYIIEHNTQLFFRGMYDHIDNLEKSLMIRSNILHNKSKQNIYSTLTLEELNDVVSVKMVGYLHQESIKPIPMTKSPQDRMMLYEERLAAEKQLFQIYRHVVYLLDIVIDGEKPDTDG